MQNIHKRHGLRDHRLYRIWDNMKRRCYNPRRGAYKHYGGRGITVCDEWKDFLPFYNWGISNGYEEWLQIDRIDNDGNYEPSNCRFITQAENKRNTRSTKLTWDDVIGIRVIKSLIPSLKYREIGEAYDITGRHVGDILNNEQWVQ